jgi:hypothetical protein
MGVSSYGILMKAFMREANYGARHVISVNLPANEITL